MRRTRPVPKPRSLIRVQYEAQCVRPEYWVYTIVKCLQFDASTDPIHMLAYRPLAELCLHTEILVNVEGR